ncbi:MAG: peptidoglycan DD-metalloendopeptidase family protein [Candidatus Eisenbacteria bacterium]|nr:peptidoglycan DD-metalloendopeptidase family protein [Candidatus Eisenbacteria bacterium]
MAEALPSPQRAIWTAELAAILAFEIDFLTEPRCGDEICLLVEEKWLHDELLGLGRIRYLSYQGQRASITAAYHQPADGAGAGYFTPDGESVRRAFLRSPLNYRRISSRFTHRRFHPILRTWRPHLGVDYAAPSGTPVVAVGNGVVILAGTNGGFGRQVKLRHGGRYETWYGHLSRFARGIRQGARVQRGEVVGYVGSTGLSTGPHLDFRVKEDGTFIDPLAMHNPREEPLPASELPVFTAALARLRELAARLPAGSLASGPGSTNGSAWGASSCLKRGGVIDSGPRMGSAGS